MEGDGGHDGIGGRAKIGIILISGEQFLGRHRLPGATWCYANANKVKVWVQDILPMGAVFAGIMVEIFIDGSSGRRPIASDVFSNRLVVVGDLWVRVQAVLKVAADGAGMGKEMKLHHLAAIGCGNLSQGGIPAQWGQPAAAAFKVHQNELLLWSRKLPVVVGERKRW